MLKIDPVYLQGLERAQTIEDLQFFVQKAIELEHSTIPPYMTAVFRLFPNQMKI